MRHFNFLAGCSLLAASAAFSQPVPPVAPPPPQPGQAQPMTQEKPKDIAAAPGTAGAKPAKWDVNARHGPGHDAQIDTRTGTSGTWNPRAASSTDRSCTVTRSCCRR